MLKMKVAGMNACFGYECKIQVGSGMVIAMATCTAVCLEALPPSPTLHFLQNQRDPGARIGVEQDGRLVKMQRDLEIMFQVRRGKKGGREVKEEEEEEEEGRESMYVLSYYTHSSYDTHTHTYPITRIVL